MRDDSDQTALDGILAALLAMGTFVAQWFWSFPCLNPGDWGDIAVAVGIRPAAHVTGGLATLVAEGAFRLFGPAGGETALRTLGHALLAGLAAGVYLVLRETFTLALRERPQLSPRRRGVMRFGAALGAIAFVAADPVWACGQSFGEPLLILALTIAALTLELAFLTTGRLACVFGTSLILGLLTAETPLGLCLTGGLVALGHVVLKPRPDADAPQVLPAVLESAKWQMTLLFLGAACAGLALDAQTFVRHDGLVASGLTSADLPLVFVREVFESLVAATDAAGGLLLVVVCLVPFSAACACFSTAADEERFLPCVTGLVFLFCAVVALCQAGPWPLLWFWSYGSVSSRVVLALTLLCNAFVLAFAAVVFGVDAFCRDPARLAVEQFGVDEAVVTGTFARRAACVGLAMLAVAVILSGLTKPTTREALGVVRDAVRAIVDEAGTAHYLFTDGALDTALERESARRGGSLRCLSLMGGNAPREAFLRTRDLADDPEDRLAFGHDAATGLRGWIRDKPARLGDVAALLGFDLWTRDGKPLPPMGGLLSRPAGFPSEASRAAGIRAARALGERVLAVHARCGGRAVSADDKIRRAFLTVQWRLARLCLARSDATRLAGGDESAARADTAFAKRLNDLNPIARDLARAMAAQSAKAQRQLTPREGLQFALARADFPTASAFAEPILDVDPANPDANFAMGMGCLRRRDFASAESYLKKCLERRPAEPTVYNNLAMVQIELRRFDAAEANVARALELAPGAAAILDTRRRLKEARGK